MFSVLCIFAGFPLIGTIMDNRRVSFIFFQAVTVTNSAIWLALSAVRIFSLTTVTVTLALTGLGSVRIVKNCDLGLENAALGLRPRAAFSRPRSQFFTIRTSQPANNIYLLSMVLCSLTSPILANMSMVYYYHFVGHCGAFCGLKWRIWRAKMYFSPLK